MSDQAEIFFDTDQPCCVGIDIGTTTVCACVLKLGDGTPLAVYRTENGSDLPPLFAGDHRQDQKEQQGEVGSILHKKPPFRMANLALVWRIL